MAVTAMEFGGGRPPQITIGVCHHDDHEGETVVQFITLCIYTARTYIRVIVIKIANARRALLVC